MAQEQPQKSGVGTEPVAEESKPSATSIERDKTETKAIEQPERYALGRAELWTSPFGFVKRMMEEMDRMVSGYGGQSLMSWSPAIETFERDGRLVLRADLPGLESKDVKVEVEGDELVISGERKHVEEKKSRGRYYSERRYGSFERRMTLPVDCNPESIDASFDNGVLEVSFAIPEPKAKTRKIEVRSGGQPEGGPRSVH